jgi:hypothetical protein
MKDEQGDVLNFIVIIPLIEEMVPFISKKKKWFPAYSANSLKKW